MALIKQNCLSESEGTFSHFKGILLHRNVFQFATDHIAMLREVFERTGHLNTLVRGSLRYIMVLFLIYLLNHNL